MKKKYLKPLAASILLLSMNLTQITAFAEEVKTNQLGAGNVTIENNVGMADTINVSGVTEGAIIKIYKDAAGGAAIATTKVAAGKTEAKLSVPQLGVGAGRVFVTLTNPRCSESNRTECSYTAEAKT
ncbi:MAG: hypothetical protein Q8936_22040, partial [Bacillota bacterium]|nr:hypothetical protein [Bacillota bacterium]